MFNLKSKKKYNYDSSSDSSSDDCHNHKITCNDSLIPNNFNGGTLNTSIIPSNPYVDLGSITSPFKSIYLSSNSLHTLYFSHRLCDIGSDRCDVGSDRSDRHDRCDRSDRHETESSDFDSFSEQLDS